MIDMPTFISARDIKESRHGCLQNLLNGLTKREKRNLMRYGTLSKRVKDSFASSRIDALLKISTDLREIEDVLVGLAGDINAFNEAVRIFEYKHGSLYSALGRLDELDRIKLLCSGEVPEVVNDAYKNSKDETISYNDYIGEFLNISFRFRHILNDVMKPRRPGRAGKVRSYKVQALLVE
jgi:hypothetical protein